MTSRSAPFHVKNLPAAVMTPVVLRLHPRRSLVFGLDLLKALPMLTPPSGAGYRLYRILVMVSFRLLTMERLLMAMMRLAPAVSPMTRLVLTGPTARTPTILVLTFLVVSRLVVLRVLLITRL